jgi:YD repeat-containing protein
MLNTKLFSNNVQATSVAGANIQRGTCFRGGRRWVYPAEGLPSRMIANGLGQVVSSAQHFGQLGFQATTFAYDRNGNQISATDPKGNVRSMVFDNANRQTRLTDPDAGITNYVYNLNGTVASTSSSAGLVTYTTDVLGRVTNVTAGSDVETYVYDTLKGLLTSASSTSNGATFTVAMAGYDRRSRPEGYTYTVPSIVGVTDVASTGFAGSYTFNNFVYDRADHLVSYKSPDIGVGTAGLSDETITTRFNYLGAPTTLTGTGVGQLVAATGVRQTRRGAHNDQQCVCNQASGL